MGKPLEKRLHAEEEPPEAAPKEAKKDGKKDAVDPEDDVEMTFFEHLGELRMRFVRALFGLVPGIAIAAIYSEDILQFLTRPLIDAYRAQNLGDPLLHFANPADGFVAYMMIALVCGLIFASPWVFYQAWAFVAPGLYREEKRMALPFVFISAAFFIGGAFFGFEFVLPPAFNALLSFAGMLPNEELRIEPTIMMIDYLDFSLRLLLALGVTFEVPIIIGALAWLGMVDYKQLLGFSRWWVVISAVAAAVLTPSGDAGTMLLVLAPLVVLYYLGIVFAFIVGPRPKPAAPGGGDDGAKESKA